MCQGQGFCGLAEIGLAMRIGTNRIDLAALRKRENKDLWHGTGTGVSNPKFFSLLSRISMRSIIQPLTSPRALHL